MKSHLKSKLNLRWFSPRQSGEGGRRRQRATLSEDKEELWRPCNEYNIKWSDHYDDDDDNDHYYDDDDDDNDHHYDDDDDDNDHHYDDDDDDLYEGDLLLMWKVKVTSG